MPVLTVSSWIRLVPILAIPTLAACETPHGPGRPISAEQSPIKFNHPLYPGVDGEYTQRVQAGGVNARTDSAVFPGAAGIVIVNYGYAAGDTYFSSSHPSKLAEGVGLEPESNEIKGQGTLPDTFPPVQWVSFSATGNEKQPLACVGIQRSGNAANRAGRYTSALVNAIECRGGYMEMGEREAAMLSGAVSIDR
jgi:hypothetical protein